MGERAWCALSFDRDGSERWCVMERRVYGDHPEYRDAERTACCGMVVTLPAGYAWRAPTCDADEQADHG